MSGETVLRILGREHSLRILRGTAEPTGAAQLAKRLEIPVAACHRRLEELAEVGLIRAVDAVAEPGESVKQYERVVDDLHVHIGQRRVQVTYEADRNPTTALDMAWEGLRA